MVGSEFLGFTPPGVVFVGMFLLEDVPRRRAKNADEEESLTLISAVGEVSCILWEFLSGAALGIPRLGSGNHVEGVRGTFLVGFGLLTTFGGAQQILVVGGALRIWEIFPKLGNPARIGDKERSCGWNLGQEVEGAQKLFGGPKRPGVVTAGPGQRCLHGWSRSLEPPQRLSPQKSHP